MSDDDKQLDGGTAYSDSLPLPLRAYNLLGQSENITDCDEHLTADVLPASSPYRRIGAGACGSVWTHGNSPYALKRADGSELRYLWKEYYMQTRLLEAFGRLPVRTRSSLVRVPQCYWYTNTSDSEYWNMQLPQFPAAQDGKSGTLIKQQPRNAMCSERIPPVSPSFSEKLIDLYCFPALKDEIKHSAAKYDCIARLYLGRRRLHTRTSRFFSLRNFPIMLDMAEELGLPILQHAEEMADALAVMHWEAGIDANDVEFVLGSPGTSPGSDTLLKSSTIASLRYNSCTRRQETPPSYASPDSLSSQLDLWLLDFDCCRLMTVDDNGIEGAVCAFFRNDPFYPRPCPADSPDFKLWEAFKCRYLTTSEAILQRRGMETSWPQRFMDCLIAKSEKTKHERGAPRVSHAEEGALRYYPCFIPPVVLPGKTTEGWKQ